MTEISRKPVFRELIMVGVVLAAIGLPAMGADATVDEAANTLTEVVVSAERRETNLQKTPIAISVVGPTELDDRHVQSLINLADGSVPSLRIATFEARQSALTVGIRGIVPFDANQTARDQGVGVYIDGVYLGRQQGLNAALFDVQRIEVLRGPQGTLFGRNTEGGAVSIITNAPTGKFGGRVSAGVGNYGSANGEIHLNLPAFANLAFKIDGLIQHQDATTTNPLEGQYGWNYYQRVGGRIAARWTPIDGFTADLAYDNAKDKNTPFYSQLVNYNPLGNTVLTVAQMQANPKVPAGFIAPLPPLVEVHTDRQSAAEIGVPQEPSVDKADGLSATLKYEVSPALELRSITAKRRVTTNQWDNSGGAHRVPFAPNGKFSRYSLSDLSQDQVSQEFQAVGSVPQLDYLLGLHYFHEQAFESAATPSTNQWNADGTAYSLLSSTAPGAGWQRGFRKIQRASVAKADSYAGFAQVTYTPASFHALHVTAGGRYTKDQRRGLLYTVVNQPTNFLFKFKDSRFNPLVTLAYDLTPDINLYAKYATGYRAGGANDRSQTFTAFGPESVKSYEIGSKMDLWDRRVRVNLAAYTMTRTGTQTDFDNVDTNPQSPTFNLHTEETRNAPGESKIKGFEAELAAKPTDRLTVGASYAYTDVNVPATQNPFLNNKLIPVFVVFTPKNAAAAYVDYEMPLLGNNSKLRMHVDANYAGRTYSFQSEPVQTDSSFLVNGRLALADVPISGGTTAVFSLWSRNLLDEAHIYRRSAANAAVLGDYANFNPPRTFGVEATLNF